MSAATARDQQWFGHPRGLSTLFFTELWERFSYYGMRTLLILFMTDTAYNGLGMGADRAGAIYGLYTFGVYALALPGGWIADRLIGQRKAVLYGGILIALGHYSMAVPSMATFFAGLFLIVLGTGPAQAQRQRHRRRPLHRQGRPARRGLLDFLHGHQYRRLCWPAGLLMARRRS